MSNILDPDQDRHSVCPDLGPNCLHRLLAVITSKEELKHQMNKQANIDSCFCNVSIYFLYYIYMSRDMRFPTMWNVRPAKPHISLSIRAVWSEPLLVAWIFFDCQSTDQTSFVVPKDKRGLQRLVWVYTFQNATLLEITCRGSYFFLLHVYVRLFQNKWERVW